MTRDQREIHRKKRILENAYRSRAPIAIFEMTDPSFKGFLACLTIPFTVVFLTPLVRPVSLFQLAFTYLIPILPIMVMWDGFVSTLRTYSRAEMIEMTNDLSVDYVWEIDTIKAYGMAFPY